MKEAISFLAWATSVCAGTIISQGGSGASYPLGYYAPYGTSNNPGIGVVSWTQTQAYSNVTISANIWQVFGYGSGTTNFYLVTAIGSGTTFAQYGVAQGSTSSLPFSPGLVTLFNLSTLGPGTYYLVIASDAVNSSWTYPFPNSSNPTRAAGVTYGGAFGARGSDVNTSYAPGSQMSSLTLGFGFSVTADPIPEPRDTVFAGLALLGLAMVLRKKLEY
jgi:hypothetical protein